VFIARGKPRAARVRSSPGTAINYQGDLIHDYSSRSALSLEISKHPHFLLLPFSSGPVPTNRRPNSLLHRLLPPHPNIRGRQREKKSATLNRETLSNSWECGHHPSFIIILMYSS
jgi:hypothetical protein